MTDFLKTFSDVELIWLVTFALVGAGMVALSFVWWVVDLTQRVRKPQRPSPLTATEILKRHAEMDRLEDSCYLEAVGSCFLRAAKAEVERLKNETRS